MLFVDIGGGSTLIRFELGEDFIVKLQQWCNKHAPNGGSFHGLGGAKGASLGFYKLDEKVYEFTDLRQPLEVVSLHGNAAKYKHGFKVHAHVVVSNEGLNTFGGHLKQMTVGPTLEVFFTAFDKPMKRVHDKDTGLDLLES